MRLDAALGFDDVVVPDLVVERARHGYPNLLRRPAQWEKGSERWPLSMPIGCRKEGAPNGRQEKGPTAGRLAREDGGVSRPDPLAALL